jgi:hypothetical protein
MPPSPDSQSVITVHNHDRNLALLFVATGAIFGIYGSGLGSLMLASLSGFRLPLKEISFASHPYAQIYGFIFEFIMGVAYILVPRFKGERLGKRAIVAAYSSYILVTTADVCFIILGYVFSYFLMDLASFFFLIGVGVFAVQTSKLAFIKKGGFPQTNPLIVEASLSSFLVGIVLVFANYAGLGVHIDIFSQSSIYLVLLGFASSMIYAVEIRSVSFRQNDYRTGAANLTWLTQGFAIFLCLSSVLFSSGILLIVSGILFLAAAIFASISLRLFGMGHPLMYRPSMTETHYKIIKYNDLAIITSFAWLFLALSLGILMLFDSEKMNGFFGEFSLLNAIPVVASSSYTRDLFIHSIAVGFIGLSVICYAPMLLPGLLGRRGPTTGLTYYPTIILNLGMLFRAAGDVDAIVQSAMPYWEALSGPLILLAIGWFLLMIHQVGKVRTNVVRQTSTVLSLNDKLLESVAELRIVEPSLGYDKNYPAFWFVCRFPNIYLLLRRIEDNTLIELLKESQYITFRLQDRTFRGNIEFSSDKNTIKKVIKLFKDKYGQRNFKNAFGTGRETIAVIFRNVKDL